MSVCTEDNTNSGGMSASSHYRNEDTWSMHTKYKFEETLGTGSFGTVVRAIDRVSKEELAIKIISNSSLTDRTELLSLRQEIEVLSIMNHRGIARFHEAHQDNENVYIVTELCRDGTLEDYVYSQEEGLYEEEALLLMRQVLAALGHIHSRHVAHRDIKMENVVFGNGEPKLIDFGLCFVRPPGGELHSTEFVGTANYAAPEILDNIPYVPERGDMWSCGIMLYAMLTGDKDFSSFPSESLEGEVPEVSAEKLMHVSSPTLALLESLLDDDPDQRPTVAEAIDDIDESLGQFSNQEI